MMKTIWIVLIPAVAAWLIPGSQAFGDTASRAALAAIERRFDEMDTNRDGRIDRGEYMEHERRKANERFDAADGNEDGFITRKEAERAMERKREEIRTRVKAWKQSEDRKRRQRSGP